MISWAMPAFNVHKVGLANPFRLLKMIELQVPYEPHQKHRGERKWLNRGFHLQTRRPDLPATTGSPRWLPLSFTSRQLLRIVRDNKHILKDQRPLLFLRDLAFHHKYYTPSPFCDHEALMKSPLKSVKKVPHIWFSGHRDLYNVHVPIGSGGR